MVATAATVPGTPAAVEVRLDNAAAPASTTLPDSLVQFSRSARFRAEVARLPGDAARSRLLEAMAAMGAVTARPLLELDWHRMLDVMVLVTREA